eukprot:4939788-Amphidinium_carterae.1
MRTEDSLDFLYARLTLGQRTLCTPHVEGDAALCVWAALAAFEGWIAVPHGCSKSKAWPAGVEWFYADLLTARDAAKLAPTELVEWINSH